jgi:hypothetical protein
MSFFRILNKFTNFLETHFNVLNVLAVAGSDPMSIILTLTFLNLELHETVTGFF